LALGLTGAQIRLLIPGLTGTAEDTNLDTLSDRADAAIARWIGFPATSTGPWAYTVSSATYIHYSGLHFSPRPRWFFLPLRPVVSITTLEEDTTQTETLATVASTDYTVDVLSGRVDLLNGDTHGAFLVSHRALKVTYVGGYATIPADITQAGILLIRHWWDRRHDAGIASSTQDGNTVVRSDLDLPDEVKMLLRPYVFWERQVG